MSKTWLVFENASAYSVSCFLTDTPQGHPKPVDGYVVTEHEGDFTVSARKAAHAVYECAKSRGLYSRNVMAGFDLSERTGMDASIAGSSGGLSFAVSFAQKLLKSASQNAESRR